MSVSGAKASLWMGVMSAMVLGAFTINGSPNARTTEPPRAVESLTRRSRAQAELYGARFEGEQFTDTSFLLLIQSAVASVRPSARRRPGWGRVRSARAQVVAGTVLLLSENGGPWRRLTGGVPFIRFGVPTSPRHMRRADGHPPAGRRFKWHTWGRTSLGTARSST